MKKRHMAIYGKIAMERGFCETCNSMALISKGRFLCCGQLAGKPTGDWEIMTQGEQCRRKPSKKKMIQILKDQNNRCIYCNHAFGTMWTRKDLFGYLNITWDHFVPFSFTSKNMTFVASCQMCNGIKTDKMFNGVEEAKEYILPLWAKKGYKYAD